MKNRSQQSKVVGQVFQVEDAYTSRDGRGNDMSTEDEQLYFNSLNRLLLFALDILQGIQTEKDSDLYHLILT